MLVGCRVGMGGGLKFGVVGCEDAFNRIVLEGGIGSLVEGRVSANQNEEVLVPFVPRIAHLGRAEGNHVGRHFFKVSADLHFLVEGTIGIHGLSHQFQVGYVERLCLVLNTDVGGNGGFFFDQAERFDVPIIFDPTGMEGRLVVESSHFREDLFSFEEPTFVPTGLVLGPGQVPASGFGVDRLCGQQPAGCAPAERIGGGAGATPASGVDQIDDENGAGLQVLVAVAASRGLEQGIQRRHVAVDAVQIDVHARFHQLGGDDDEGVVALVFDGLDSLQAVVGRDVARKKQDPVL